jgi:Na+-transporting NADH:ubiquinone oxidoreductase subunit C
MKIRWHESARTVGFMGLLTLVLITSVSALHLATAERVQRNAELYLRRAVLEAAGLEPPETPAEVHTLFQRTATALSTAPDGAPDRFLVRTPDRGDGGALVFKRSGRGLWGVIGAVIAYRPADGTFGQMRLLEHNETPGLGARIEEPWFQRQIEGKTGPFVLRPEGSRSTAPTEIDAITGATITSSAVRDMLNAVVRDARQTQETPAHE